jgi:LmbE family N-acetylglucosaminyl deacetylase
MPRHVSAPLSAPRILTTTVWDAVAAVIAGVPARRQLSVAIVAAHPDDEIVSAAAMLRRLTLGGADLYVVHVTDGAPRDGRDARAHGFASAEAYRRARHNELVSALVEAQIQSDHLAGFGFPDQKAPYSLIALVDALFAWVRRHPVDVILSHPFEGGHPDHDATAFAVHVTAAALRRMRGQPLLVEFTSYHAGPNGIRTGSFLPDSGPEPAKLVLTSNEQAVKRRACNCFTSQAATLAHFSLERELFRIAPAYAFAQRPHEGRLFYEYFDWGLDGRQWQARASEALGSLGLGLDTRI